MDAAATSKRIPLSGSVAVGRSIIPIDDKGPDDSAESEAAPVTREPSVFAGLRTLAADVERA